MIEKLPNPNCLIDKAKTAANYLLDLVLGAEEEFSYKGSTTPANIQIFEAEPSNPPRAPLKKRKDKNE